MAPRAPGRGQTKPASSAEMRKRVTLLIGDRRRSVLALSVCSILSAFTEAAMLALVAQVAATLVTGAKHLSTHIGPFHVHSSLGTLIAIAFAFALARVALQIPLSRLPARISSEVQAALRTRL